MDRPLAVGLIEAAEVTIYFTILAEPVDADERSVHALEVNHRTHRSCPLYEVDDRQTPRIRSTQNNIHR